MALGIAAQRGHHAWTEFDTTKNPDPLKHRPSVNCGYCQIDFGGQWIMGRMIVLGHGRQLYHRQVHWQVVRAAYPPEREPPIVAAQRFPLFLKDPKYQSEVIWSDPEWMLYWFMGSDSPQWANVGMGVGICFQQELLQANPFAAIAVLEASKTRLTPEVVEEISKPAIGGPLYPPVHALLYSPLGLIDDPAKAYRVFQGVCLLLAFLAGFCVRWLSRGHIWASVATAMILLFPGFRPGLDLGQNAIVTLTILLGGLALGVRGRPILGGIVWGMLAFKPVYAVTFLLLPLMLRQWRFAFAMMATGALSILVSLPIVGVQTWFDWLTVGQDATKLYNTNETWNSLSRDLHGLIRRLMIDYTLPEAERNTLEVSALCWSLWGFVFTATVLLTIWKGGRQWISPVTALGLIGLFLCSYRFMYYDVLLAAAGMFVALAWVHQHCITHVFVLLDSAGRVVVHLASLPYVFFTLMILNENWFIATGIEVTGRFANMSFSTTNSAGQTGLHVPIVMYQASVYYPTDTLIALLLWCILAISVLMRPREAAAEPGQYPATA